MYSRHLHVLCIYDSGTDHTHEYVICKIVVNFSSIVVLSLLWYSREWSTAPHLCSSTVSLSDSKTIKSLLLSLHNMFVSTRLEYAVGTWGYFLTITDCGNLTESPESKIILFAAVIVYRVKIIDMWYQFYLHKCWVLTNCLVCLNHTDGLILKHVLRQKGEEMMTCSDSHMLV